MKIQITGRPTQVMVMGVPYSIEYVGEDVLDQYQVGETCSTERTIKITASQSEDACHSTLLHEAIHAILAVSGAVHGLSEAAEERMVLALENGLIGLKFSSPRRRRTPAPVKARRKKKLSPRKPK